MKFGFFDDANREYVITTPKTPLPWINYLGWENKEISLAVFPLFVSLTWLISQVSSIGTKVSTEASSSFLTPVKRLYPIPWRHS